MTSIYQTSITLLAFFFSSSYAILSSLKGFIGPTLIDSEHLRIVFNGHPLDLILPRGHFNWTFKSPSQFQFLPIRDENKVVSSNLRGFGLGLFLFIATCKLADSFLSFFLLQYLSNTVNTNHLMILRFSFLNSLPLALSWFDVLFAFASITKFLSNIYHYIKWVTIFKCLLIFFSTQHSKPMPCIYCFGRLLFLIYQFL